MKRFIWLVLLISLVFSIYFFLQFTSEQVGHKIKIVNQSQFELSEIVVRAGDVTFRADELAENSYMQFDRGIRGDAYWELTWKWHNGETFNKSYNSVMSTSTSVNAKITIYSDKSVEYTEKSGFLFGIVF